MGCHLLLIVAFLFLLQVMLPSPGYAQLACGDSITTSTGLTGDLNCSNYPYDPLHIDADNVTFNLNGHTLTCSSQWGWSYTPYEYDVEGIRATGHTGVKVLGPGKITNCGRAITIEGGSGNIAQGLYLTGNNGGIVFIGGANSTARDNVIVKNQCNAIGTSGSVNIQILENYLVANGGNSWPYCGMGFTNDNTSSATFTHNYIVGNEKGGLWETGASALTAQISNNIILGNGGNDLSLRGTDDVVTDTICETSDPAGLCTPPLPRFPFDMTANQPPTANFTATTFGFTVKVSDTSTDTDGTIVAWAWDYGNGPTAQTSHTYAAAGTYDVTLRVTDNGGATASTTKVVTVSPPAPPPAIHIGGLVGAASTAKPGWQATVTVTVQTASESPVSSATVTGTWSGGVTESTSCTTGTTGTCTVTSPRLKGAPPVTFTVTGVTHPTLLYDSSANDQTAITVARP